MRMNKILKIKIITIFILVFIVNPFSFTISGRNSYSNEPNQSVFKNPMPKLASDSSTSPFNINSNSQLASLAAGGSGTPLDPYIIKNYVIDNCTDNTPGVSIQNTNDFFILQNFSIDSCYDGFYLNGVTNGKIINSKTQNDRSDGFDVYFSRNIDFINDSSSLTNDTGFFMYQCLKCLI